MKRWNCVIDKQTTEEYKRYFKERGIYFEPSEVGNQIYISLLASDEEASAFNEWVSKEVIAGSVS